MASTDKNNNGTTSMFMNNAMVMQKQKKITQGRKKIEIKKIDNVSNRQVTFSKRRAGLFKKASELCILTGAEVAIIVQSSGKRVYAFGHPSVDGVIDKYLAGTSSSSAVAGASAPSSSSRTLSAAEMHEHNLEYNRLCQELDVEKKKLELEEKAKSVNSGGNFWWDEPIDHLGLEELKQYMEALEELRKNLLTRADELALFKSSGSMAMNNVDLNQTMPTTFGVGGDDLISNHYHQTNNPYCCPPPPSSIIPYSNSADYPHFANQ